MTKNKITKEAEIVEEVKAPTVGLPKTNKNDSGLIFWALLLIAVGILLVADSFELVNLDFWALISLWPLILVLAGLGILAERGRFFRVLAVFGQIMIVVFAALVVVGVVSLDRPQSGQVITGSFEKQETAKRAEIAISAAKKLTIAKHDSDEIITYNGTGFDVNRQLEGETEQIQLRSSSKNLNLNDLQTNVKLGQKIPLSVEIDFGAGELEADFSGLKLQQLDIDSGASDVKLKLDSVDQKRVLVNLDLGMSSAELSLPVSAGVILTNESGLSNNNFSDLESQDEKVYRSSNIDRAATVYEIKLNSGMTNFKLNRY